LGVLRGRELPGPAELPELIARFTEHTGVPARLKVLGAPRDLPAEARVALYRAAQEALTNVTRHASAEAVTVQLCWGPGEVVLEIDDIGQPPTATPSGTGLGLVGMQERAALAGGTVVAGPTEGGFQVAVRLPL
ncbi:MAG: sensor histidine kinase, partial [Mycobacteriales bacterium]